MAENRASQIDLLVELLDRYYLFPDVGERVGQVIRDRYAAGAYGGLDDGEFADAVTADTVEASGDLHLRLRFSPEMLPSDHIVPHSGRRPAEAEAEGHGIARVEVLDGRIGLIDIRRLFPLSMSRDAMRDAMTEISNTAALIVDLRQCAGGEPEMVAYVASFLFDEHTHLVDLVFPRDDTRIEWWTEWPPPTPRFGGVRPVHVLIGRDTISGGEGLAYDLQQTGRATLLGEPTAGSANFDYRYRVADHLMFSVPSGHPENAVSGEGWEGTGITPDVFITSDRVLEAAQRMSLDAIRIGPPG